MRTKSTQKNWDWKTWTIAISDLPEGLTLSQASKHLGKGYVYTCIRLKQYGYKIRDTRGGFKGRLKLTPKIIKNMDWNLSHAANGRKYRVSRERIRQVWNAVGKPRTKYSLQHHTSSFYKQ